jgi:hypothetical protein
MLARLRASSLEEFSRQLDEKLEASRTGEQP